MSRSVSKINRNLWIGDICSPNDAHFLKTHKIDAIINVSTFSSQKNRIDDKIKIYDFHLNDEDPISTTVINETSKLLYKLRKENTLVYCDTGINMSATVICKYLMDNIHLTSNESFALVKSANNRRGIKTSKK